MRSALKWTVGFLIFLVILLILGYIISLIISFTFYILFFFSRIFVPQLATLPSMNSTSEWDRVKYLIDHFDSSSKLINQTFLLRKKIDLLGVQDSILFSIFTLSIIGFFLLTIYTVNNFE